MNGDSLRWDGLFYPGSYRLDSTFYVLKPNNILNYRMQTGIGTGPLSTWKVNQGDKISNVSNVINLHLLPNSAYKGIIEQNEFNLDGEKRKMNTIVFMQCTDPALISQEFLCLYKNKWVGSVHLGFNYSQTNSQFAKDATYAPFGSLTWHPIYRNFARQPHIRAKFWEK